MNLYSDAGVVPGNAYDMDVTVVSVTPTCAPDGFEANDTDTTAAPIADGSYPGLTACPDDTDDYYAIGLLTGDELSADIFFVDDEGDIDLRIIDPSGTTVEFSTSSSDDESVGPHVASMDGDYLIRVNLYSDAGVVPGNAYDLVVDVVTASPNCAYDDLEPNDSTSSPAFAPPAWYPGLSACPTDDDYFQVFLDSGDEITVDLTFSDAEGDIDLAILDAAGTWVAGSSSSNDNESATYTATSAGLHQVRAFLYLDAGGQPGNPYDMDLFVDPAAPPCTPGDAFEPNDTDTTAASVWATTFYALGACPAEGDYYAIDLAVGDVLTVDFLFSDAEGDIDVDLYDPSGAWVDGSSSSSDDETLTYTADAAGAWVIRAELYSDTGVHTGNFYWMNVGVQ